MTPERKAWWDSLPAEEKRVRKSIKGLLFGLGACKESLTEFNAKPFYDRQTQQAKICCKVAKQAIKALRKQIAMRPVIKKDFKMFRYCPTCDCILNVSKARPFCDKCGQKLRWG